SQNRADDHDDFPAGLTTIFPTMRGCIEQKYSFSPGAVKVWEKVSSVSTAADLNFPSFSRTLCGVSSALVQVTVVPGATTKAGGVKVKSSIRTEAPLAAAGVAVSPRRAFGRRRDKRDGEPKSGQWGNDLPVAHQPISSCAERGLDDGEEALVPDVIDRPHAEHGVQSLRGNFHRPRSG